MAITMYRDTGNFTLNYGTGTCTFGAPAASCQATVANGATFVIEASDNTKTVSIPGGSTPNVDATCTKLSYKWTCTADQTKGSPQTWHIAVG